MTRYAGIIGYPLGHSISPAFQQAAFDHCRIDAQYLTWPTPPEDVARRVRSLRGPGIMGANVTVPHKEAVMPYLDGVADLAQAVGAVNTIVNRGGQLEGHNTDVPGFMQALREDGGFHPEGKRVLLLGAGGAARAVAHGLLEAGVSALTIANRSVERAVELAVPSESSTPIRAVPLTEEALSASDGWDLIVNTTSVGMAGSPGEGQSPLPEGLIPSNGLVYDIVYNPENTPLLVAARRAGARTLGGLPMLIYQGAESFRLWTRMQPPIGVMFAAARRALPG